jgi:hypothetical protein
MHFCIRACDVSALAGRNVFRSRRVAIRRLIENKVQMTRTYTASHNVNKKLITCIRKGPCYQTAVSCDKLSSEICTQAERECKDIILRTKDNIESESEKLYKRYQHLYLKDRGVVVENVVIHKLREAGHHILSANKKERTFSKTFTSQNGQHTYTIFGCVDCIDEFVDGSRALVEIKSRKQQTFVYTHEIDQIITYLVLSEWTCGYLVEYIDDQIQSSNYIDLESAKRVWENDIRDSLEKSLCEASQKIINLLP